MNPNYQYTDKHIHTQIHTQMHTETNYNMPLAHAHRGKNIQISQRRWATIVFKFLNEESVTDSNIWLSFGVNKAWLLHIKSLL